MPPPALEPSTSARVSRFFGTMIEGVAELGTDAVKVAKNIRDNPTMQKVGSVIVEGVDEMWEGTKSTAEKIAASETMQKVKMATVDVVEDAV